MPLQQVLGLEVLQIFNISQTAERSTSASLNQVVNDIAEGYSKALEQANAEIACLRLQIDNSVKAESTVKFCQ